jgi:hypothetical protein
MHSEMSEFPRTTVGGVSLSRMIIGTNWFLGFSHTSVAKDEFIKEHMDRKRVADIMEVFVRAGVDTVMGLIQVPVLHEAVQEVQPEDHRHLHSDSSLHSRNPRQGLRCRMGREDAGRAEEPGSHLLLSAPVDH